MKICKGTRETHVQSFPVACMFSLRHMGPKPPCTFSIGTHLMNLNPVQSMVQHGGLVVSTVTSQQEGPGFDARSARLTSRVSWVCRGWGRTFLCGVCMFSLRLREITPTIKNAC